ncbi:MAG: penicillin-binding transpeptidase domain-containing protein, partial [Alphaproteobacteria bacterium]|nr:penicillin-binding transpeptidase domain-containing protein [Alphaproteobacteria bacterium]
MDDILQEKFYRRTLILGGLQGGLFLGLAGHLYYLQILQKDHYKKLSDQNRIHRFLILPERGLILDHKNTILAQSKNTYIGYFDRNKLQDVGQLIQQLKNHIEIDAATEKWIYKQIRTKSKIEPIMIKENLSYAEASRLEFFLSELEGVHTDHIKSREYVRAEPFAHLVGYVSAPTQQEKTNGDPLFMAPGFKTGKTGLERYFNDHLSGVAGSKKVEVNAYRRVVRTLENEEPTKGCDLNLNIDADLQTKIYDLLMQHQSGACMLMDVETGAVRAFVSAPGYDTNAFVGKITHDHWHDLSNNMYRPLINKLTSGLYAPGSVFKMIVALAALEKNLVQPHDRTHCSGYHDVNGHTFHCWAWKNGGHGYVNMAEAIAASCDIYFYKLA